MKTSLILKDDILKEAIEATGVHEKTALIHLGLQELIRKAARERILKLAGSDPYAKAGPRRKNNDPK